MFSRRTPQKRKNRNQTSALPNQGAGAAPVQAFFRTKDFPSIKRHIFFTGKDHYAQTSQLRMYQPESPKPGTSDNLLIIENLRAAMSSQHANYLISDDCSLAIVDLPDENRPKAFFAKFEVIMQTQRVLEKQKARIRLIQTGNLLKIGSNHTLAEVFFEPDTEGSTFETQKRQLKFPNMPFRGSSSDPTRYMFGFKDLSEHETPFAIRFRHPFGMGRPVDTTDKKKPGLEGDFEGVQGTVMVMGSSRMSDNSYEVEDQLYVKRNREERRKDDAAYSKKVKKSRRKFRQREKRLGINKHAHPKVGESIVTLMRSDKDEDVGGFEQGNYHGGVVAQSLDGKDYVCIGIRRRLDLEKKQLENYYMEAGVETRGMSYPELFRQMGLLAETTEGQKAYATYQEATKYNAPPHQSSFFRMYGSQEGQSYHERQTGKYFNVPSPLTVILSPTSTEIPYEEPVEMAEEAYDDSLSSGRRPSVHTAPIDPVDFKTIVSTVFGEQTEGEESEEYLALLSEFESAFTVTSSPHMSLTDYMEGGGDMFDMLPGPASTPMTPSDSVSSTASPSDSVSRWNRQTLVETPPAKRKTLMTRSPSPEERGFGDTPPPKPLEEEDLRSESSTPKAGAEEVKPKTPPPPPALSKAGFMARVSAHKLDSFAHNSNIFHMASLLEDYQEVLTSYPKAVEEAKAGGEETNNPDYLKQLLEEHLAARYHLLLKIERYIYFFHQSHPHRASGIMKGMEDELERPLFEILDIVQEEFEDVVSKQMEEDFLPPIGGLATPGELQDLMSKMVKHASSLDMATFSEKNVRRVQAIHSRLLAIGEGRRLFGKIYSGDLPEKITFKIPEGDSTEFQVVPGPSRTASTTEKGATASTTSSRPVDLFFPDEKHWPSASVMAKGGIPVKDRDENIRIVRGESIARHQDEPEYDSEWSFLEDEAPTYVLAPTFLRYLMALEQARRSMLGQTESGKFSTAWGETENHTLAETLENPLRVELALPKKTGAGLLSSYGEGGWFFNPKKDEDEELSKTE
ncbi:hypothetical protein FUAX_51490 (plasmid) [Fulvitalea axinellae]|uniref:Uncharacterized protein n=1 Tax=Fulvitalea axinellae TaxID=1182444 RepID=A0AAU9CY31_9BACT|nr:hypothetical protein FUAX_51490 [Fulvitalea axinellae]